MILLHEPERVYHAREQISKSTLDWIAVSPLHYWARYVAPKEQRIIDERTPAMALGSLVHALVLEPATVAERYAEIPAGIDRRTKDGKAAFSAFEAQLGDREAVTAEAWDTARAMADAVAANRAAASLLAHAPIREAVVLWESDGIARRARIDAAAAGSLPMVIDLKTTSDASPDGFARAIANGRYHVQAAWYLDGLAAQGKGYASAASWPFVWVAVENKPPYAVAVYGASERMVARGRELAARDLALFRECRENHGTAPWPSYTAEPMEIDLPAWAQSDRNTAKEI
jgi:hypothetical protein